jgi:hypothetical protein
VNKWNVKAEGVCPGNAVKLALTSEMHRLDENFTMNGEISRWQVVYLCVYLARAGFPIGVVAIDGRSALMQDERPALNSAS